MADVSIHVIGTETVRAMDCTRLARRMPERYERAMRFRQERDQLLCLGAGLLMMDVLGIRDEREIIHGPYDKPYAPGRQAFNISHSGSLCVLACGDVGHIGVDIEKIDARYLEVAETVYTERELTWMQKDPVERFFRLWTWKESVMKATGMGLNLAPRSFEVLPFADGKPVWAKGQNWYSWEGRLDSCRISLCLDEPIGQVRLTELTAHETPRS